MPDSLQAKDIDDHLFASSVRGNGLRPTGWTSIFTIADHLGVPWKVARAKSAAFIRRGLATGCTCGCRGDIELTPKGDEMFPRGRGLPGAA